MSGLSYFLKAFSQLNRSGLRRFIWLPLIINILLFASLSALGFHWVAELSDWLKHFLPDWLSWLTWILWPFFLASSLLIFFYCFSLVTNLIGAPFNALLSEKVQFLSTGQRLVEQNFWQGVKSMPQAIKRQGQFILYYIPRAVLCLLFFFIPGVNFLAPALWFLFNAWMIGLQYLDYPTDNNQMNFKELRDKARANRWLVLSFGASVLVITLIPIINFLVMPTAVVGATQLYLDNFRHENCS